MAETSEMELDLLQRRAREVNFYVGRHKNYDPAIGGGDLYIMHKRRTAMERSPSLLKYATVDRCWQFLNEHG